ncbi:DNA gyrase subunit A [Fusobacterium necrophorum]|uniref:DNA gyrase subunit A n=2 Tax=Fusobacterium necrophorum subsp. funduliforme TaxID=143387 RepID=A0A161QVV2_9FUSO|nr:DNA gyrase subunit A [Fusobacterium necrophorum]AYV92179.1 DNA gyrase subunit A [Fusobacterium necrophorum subsp. funduliforme]EIJ69534.1 DNA gyrase, A subunit [Fusobacterium necrophorum subsp. funduliforme ATCC 51357]EYD68580.1 DNA gyrase subunit A [Fusobacterium necrophorum subsp. funduliforme B35]KAB0552380.1 DNA gyrase subunit A [Fusobacterium necrophorum subsp. funduliforme]KID48038.1 DNA gyrase subunit A [Fusobacterium necrophorum subsp. funduliforme B35]
MSNISNRYIEEELKESYLDYSMSVIVSRALPDVRDGLKPVHRRILFAMNEMGMTNDKPFKKSARIVGEVLGKYHPHGDTAVYNTMVRMAQEFNYRYMLVEGHGNFGSIDGDSAAAMRYTEARMSKITAELLEDIDKNTIDFRKNFDDSLDEPTVLPSKLPHLLLNGSTGIAVGMATNIPPHNLGELVDGSLQLIDNPDISDLELMKYIQGPDFPTGGIIDGKKGIRDAYLTGRGKIRVRGKVKIEENKNGKFFIIIEEIPYQLNKATLIERIANLVKEKKITGIVDLRDESNREGIRVVIELKKGEEPELVLNKLYKYTELQSTFGVIMLALVNNVPKILTLKQMLSEYIGHRFQVITRRILFDLDKAQKRAHILQGYRIALENINRIIEMIRSSKDANQAKEQLIEKYAFTEIQAKSILDMRLQRLTGLEREKVEAEYHTLEKLILELQDILSHDSKIYDIMKKELLEVKEVYGDNRRTHIEEERMEILPEDLIKDEEMIITCTNKGYIKRIEANKYKSQNRGGKGVSGLNTIDDDVVDNILTASNLDTLMIFTDKGKVYNIKVYQLPELSRQSRGRLISNILRIGEEEKIRAIIKTRIFDKEKELIFVTKQGIVKKTSLEEFKNINTGGLIAIKFKEEDDLIYVGLVEASDNEVFIATRRGFAVRFPNDNVRPTGRNTMGVKGIELREKDEVVSALLIKEKEMDILTITENGYGKRTRLDEYPSHNRGGKGVINLRCNEKTGNIVSVLSAFDEEELVCITSNGVIIRTPMHSISRFSRAAQGVIIMKVASDEKVASITRIKAEEKEEI